MHTQLYSSTLKLLFKTDALPSDKWISEKGMETEILLLNDWKCHIAK